MLTAVSCLSPVSTHTAMPPRIICSIVPGIVLELVLDGRGANEEEVFSMISAQPSFSASLPGSAQPQCTTFHVTRLKSP